MQVLAALSHLFAALSQPEGEMSYPQMKNLIILLLLPFQTLE
jgi:hypothetical protein